MWLTLSAFSFRVMKPTGSFHEADTHPNGKSCHTNIVYFLYVIRETSKWSTLAQAAFFFQCKVCCGSTAHQTRRIIEVNLMTPYRAVSDHCGITKNQKRVNENKIDQMRTMIITTGFHHFMFRTSCSRCLCTSLPVWFQLKPLEAFCAASVERLQADWHQNRGRI